MDYFQDFMLGLTFSFLGSVPPGTLNICVLQLGIEGKVRTAIKFAIAVSIIEYPYTWIAVEFEDMITSTPAVVRNFQLISACVMFTLGALSLISAKTDNVKITSYNESGFRRGLVLSILNPMAIPFWITITAYLKAQHWIALKNTPMEHAYIFGTSIGVMLLLLIFIFLADKVSPYIQKSRITKLAPGIMLLLLGVYAFVKYFSN